MANFMQAVKWIKEGKKVKRKVFLNIELSFSKSMNYVGIFRIGETDMYRPICISDIEAKDWGLI